jgi:asparagine N-glycosylation enzyme membrane subunit Stt3
MCLGENAPHMNATSKRLFFLLICAQALHSIEEYYFSLWEVLAPARFLSGLVSTDLPFGFAVVNAAIVAFGVWSYAWPVRRNLGYAIPLLWFWTILEAANGIGHMTFAIASRSYFPGGFTAPLLLILSGLLGIQLTRRSKVA